MTDRVGLQPIETATKDKRVLLARVAKYGLCGVADGYMADDGTWRWPYKDQPTHWMHLNDIRSKL